MVKIIKCLPHIIKDVKILAAVNIEIALSNLTGSPEGPGFPGFPLAPWNKTEKPYSQAPTGQNSLQHVWVLIFPGN